MKKIIALLLGIIIVISNRNCSLRVYAESSSDALYSQEEYDGFELCWTNNGERDILLSATNGKGQISFVYDELGRRISKTGMDGKVTSFAYDDLGRLAYEEREEHIFFYEYDDEGYLKTITINQVRYVVELDDMSVSKLLDEMGNVIVVYQYENGLLNGVFGVNSDGELIDRSDDKEFVGNWNRITYKSYYFDEETGWYYRGKYYDAKAGRFVDGRNNVATENGLDREPQASILSATTSTVEAYATKLYDETMADSSHGIPLDYSAYWYMGLSDIELLTRMIYGENTWLAIDQKAITWVTWNRMTSGENTAAVSRIREVVAANNQFASITGGEQHSDQARNPDVSGLGWYNATRLACQVYAVAYYGNNLSELIDKPLGINTQTQFRSYNSVFTNGSMKVDSDGTIYMEFLGSQTGETIRYDVVDIAIPGSGNFDTLSELQMAYLEDYSPGDINIYFNLE